MVRPVTERMIQAVMLDIWPPASAICDFGLHTQQHYEAIYYPIREGEITPEQLDDALGNGPKLTALVARCGSNPHKDIVFETDYDFLTEEG